MQGRPAFDGGLCHEGDQHDGTAQADDCIWETAGCCCVFFDLGDLHPCACGQQQGKYADAGKDRDGGHLGLAPETGDKRANAQYLRWAAQLHEIGLAISHKGYHRHGEYIVRNADFQGFSQSEQAILACLVRLHRGRFCNEILTELPAGQQASTHALALLLRIAVLVHRGRDPETHPPLTLELDGAKLRLAFAQDWLEAHPLTREDLDRENVYLARVGYKLKITE